MVIKKISCACGSFPRSIAHRERSLLGQAQSEWRGEKWGGRGGQESLVQRCSFRRAAGKQDTGRSA